MKYTKEQLEAPLGEIIVDNIKRKDLGDWKRWRIVSTNGGFTPFSVEELNLKEGTGFNNVNNVLSNAKKGEFYVNIFWKVSKEYNVVSDLIPAKFNTQQEAKEYIDKEIASLTPVTKHIVGTYPAEEN